LPGAGSRSTSVRLPAVDRASPEVSAQSSASHERTRRAGPEPGLPNRDRMSGPVPTESERPHRPPRAPGVTVVIATHGRRAELDHTLTALEALPERPEVVVVDNPSPDDLPDLIARRHPVVRLVKLHENRGAAGRNVGAEVATTPLVA